MSYRHLIMLFLILCLSPLQSSLAASDPNDTEGSKDPAVFTRMPGFYIYRCDVREFDRYEFAVSPEKKEPVEGRHTFIVYYANEGITLPSGLQVNRNYLNAAKAVGGELVYEYDDGGLYSIIKIVQGDAEIWAEVSGAGNNQYSVQIVEKQLMRQDVVASADALATSISGTGRVVVHGVYFDTNKADLKPESEPALTEIVKMLKADANLKLYVVGHTDNVGQFAANVKLSQDRAASVVNALVGKHGIAAARLIPYGDGPTAPMAANNNDAGRAKNRRVELVAQ
jgi:outer membrane protein OmpA-like peptidoglycan-associated protein